MNKRMTLKQIGTIHTPYTIPRGIPIQGTFDKNITGTAELYPEYKNGLKDLEGFSHVILIYYFHLAKEEKLVGKPFLEDEQHGIFAIRGPMRPNHIGLSIVKIENIDGLIITFSEVDILDGTPLLDIKPYISYFDARQDVKNGWLEKHFAGGKIPKRVKID
ncbi:MAG: tRNA (N6-threonylcarbamoyladenosine(37)-N6)-methyltransferase TrmO [bacterium]